MHNCIKGVIIIQMKVGLYYNSNSIETNKKNIEKFFSALSEKNIKCERVDSVNKIKGLDILVVFGGDGTILTIASECAAHGVKIIGINYGHIGFLAEFEPNQLAEALNLVCNGNFTTEYRSMLCVTHSSGGVYYALNDAVIQRSTSGNSFSNTINLHAEINGSTVDNFSADGLILSTPTGSTAYSLAAGGSILAPDLGAFIMTPICAHSLHSRPIVFSDNCTVTVNRIDNRGTVNLIIDGKAVDEIKKDDIITVKKAERYVEFISLPNGNFYNKLLYKLNVWGK